MLRAEPLLTSRLQLPQYPPGTAISMQGMSKTRKMRKRMRKMKRMMRTKMKRTMRMRWMKMCKESWMKTPPRVSSLNLLYR